MSDCGDQTSEKDFVGLMENCGSKGGHHASLVEHRMKLRRL